MRCTFAVALLSILVLGFSGCERKDYGTVAVPADHSSYNASDYSLRLPPGWYAHAAFGGINYYPPDAHPPFRSNIFIKTGPLGVGGIASGMSTMQRELGQLLTDSATWEEQSVRIGDLSGRQARFSGNLAVPGFGPSPVQGLMLAVGSGRRGFAILFISKAADYSRYESTIEQIIASFQPR